MDGKHSHIDIPKAFYSFSTGALFDRCLECEMYLLDGDTEYFIEKAIKKYEGFDAQDVIFEYAICIQCAERMRNSMSKASQQSIQQYFMDNVDLLKRMEIMQSNPNNPETWMDKCLIKGERKSGLNEYQIYAHCNGSKLNLTQMPYLVSGAALEEISAVLSPETLDEFDDFSRRHFGPPPELAEPLPFRRVMLI
ncbi:MAG TPA: hypothetical protein PKL31_11735 [Fulvivirga sp.]|nr:hypothetical protein [Fulvivirga sp.]